MARESKSAQIKRLSSDRDQLLDKYKSIINYGLNHIIGESVWGVAENGDIFQGRIGKITYSQADSKFEKMSWRTVLSVFIKTISVNVGNTTIEIEQKFDILLTNKESYTPPDTYFSGAVFHTLQEAEEYQKDKATFESIAEKLDKLENPPESDDDEE